jgi:hypothetical protein
LTFYRKSFKITDTICEQAEQPRALRESARARKVRAPQGKNNG